MPNNLITLDAAIKMTALYRREMNNILADPYKGQEILTVCETFDRSAFDTLLNEAGCTAVRIYYGMSDDLKMHAIIVGVNSNNEDLLPASITAETTTDEPVILEESIRDPGAFTPPSPLNP